MNNSDLIKKNFSKEINLDNLYSALVECFSVILCGYITGKLNIITQREVNGLDVFVRTFSLPCVIFLSLAQLDFSSVNWSFLGSILVSKSIVFIGVVLFTSFLSRPIDLGKLGLYAVFCTQSNDFALGYPILKALYGTENPNYPSYVYLLAPISLAVLNPIAYVFLEVSKHKKKLNSSDENEDISHNKALESESSCLPNEANNSSDTRQIEDSLFRKQISKTDSGLKLIGVVILNIITNPVMLMTVLGLLGNLFYSYIKFIGVVLNAFATVFSTTALFVLGLKMVGGSHKMKGSAFVTCGILIITKLLVLPLVTRELVSLLHPGRNASETLNLSSFGFIYGTFPTAPMVFVLASQYDIEIDSMSNSLVVCTFLSAPLMYISAKMIFMDFLPSDNYYQKLESFAFNISIVGIPLGIWLYILFITNKSFSKIPHKITGFLIISQIIICIGVALQPLNEKYEPWTSLIQFSLLAFGIYSSRLWTCFLAITLVLLQSRSLCFVIKLVPALITLAWGVPTIFVIGEGFASFSGQKFGSLMNPDFKNGKFQSAVTLFILTLSFIGTVVCLIVQHRYQLKFSKYLTLVQEVNSDKQGTEAENPVNYCSSSQGIGCSSKETDIEEIINEHRTKICDGSCKSEVLCSSKFECTEEERNFCEQTIKQYNTEAINENIDEDHEDREILRHIILLLLLVTSMFVNLMLSIWTLVVDDAISGVYIELLFLNIILNIGQVFLTFSVFGFKSKSLLVTLTNRWRKFFYGAENIILTPIEDLGFETTHVCHQFIAHHLQGCEKEIAKPKRLRLRLYKDCFKGKTLVSWLQMKRLAKDEAEAIQYASHLLEGRVLRHIENRHHFENSDLLFTFRQ